MVAGTKSTGGKKGTERQDCTGTLVHDLCQEMGPSADNWCIKIHIRLAGVDAPELAHFGRPSQPYSQEAIDWLTRYILHRRIRAYVYKKDQYDRAVATVYVRQWLLRRDVGLEMLRRGLATVYEAKSGAEFGMLESKYKSAERWAKMRQKGMWGSKKPLESPRDYKTRMGGQAD